MIRMKKQVKLSGRILRKEKGSDGYDEECQIKVEERNKSQIKVLKRRMRINTENYRNK